jgi:hypothetical protein
MTQIMVLPWLSGKKENTTLAIAGITLLGFGLLALGTLPFLALLVLMGALVAFGFGILLTTLVTLISVNAAVEAQGGTLGIALLCCTGADCGSHLSCLLLCVRIICWRSWVCVHCLCGFNVCNDSVDDCFQGA